MGLFNKLKEILFDEETVEIPVITKEEKKEKKEEVKVKKEVPVEQPKRRTQTNSDDEVIIHKIETPKREPKKEVDDIFDMPKLKEEAKEEVKKNNFTFPIFEDEDDKPVVEKREKRETAPRKEKQEPKKEAPPKKRASGYTNAFDYSYGKYKGDYKSSIESGKDVVQETLNKKEEHKVFTPSPIISPVYGVLNENYKKEDIVTKDDYKPSVTSDALDLDSVRRKAYGTLEDEIEGTLSYREEEDVEVDSESGDILDENGISISDLLVDPTDDNDADEDQSELDIEELESEDETDLMEALVSDQDSELDFDDLLGGDDEEEETVEEEREPELDVEEIAVEEEKQELPKQEKKKEKETKSEMVPPSIILPENDDETNDQKSDGIGEEDLFDLIDSLYEGKGEE